MLPLFCSPDVSAALIALSIPVHAASSSPWAHDTRSGVRLVAARPIVHAGTVILRAGIEFKLHTGWWTYGCDPGDSGVPPHIDFNASENVKSISVLWPKPERFNDGGAFFLGYKEGIVLPVHIAPRDSRKPVTLRLKLDYAICETICVPSKAEVNLAFSRRDGAAFNAVVAAAEARVPNPPQECLRPGDKWAIPQ